MVLHKNSFAVYSKKSFALALQCKSNGWFLYEMQKWVEMGQLSRRISYLPVGNDLFKVNNKETRRPKLLC